MLVKIIERLEVNCTVDILCSVNDLGDIYTVTYCEYKRPIFYQLICHQVKLIHLDPCFGYCLK